jgi:N-acetylmuramoyl-L-alanine amidase
VRRVASAALSAVLTVVVGGTLLGAPAAADTRPLAGKVIVIDPGHQLGNSNPKFAKQMAQTVFNGAITKACNTTGTATNSGYPEATFTWKVAQRLKRRLERAGAKVVMTRTTNSRDDWGPCVWDRAKLANRVNADAMLSIHADGAAASSKGFFAMTPALIKGWTDDVVVKDRRLATAMIEGMKLAGAPPSNYIGGQLMVSRDTTSLNFSNVPTVTVEVGNMRNASDAARMTSTSGQKQYAKWLFAGLDNFFGRA